MKKSIVLVTLAVILGWSSNAMASLWGNPLPENKPGQIVIGAGGLIGDTNYLLGEYGLSKEGTVRVHFGLVDWGYYGGSVTGNEFGGGYKHDLGMKIKIGTYTTSVGVMGYYTTGSVKDSTGYFEIKYSMIDLGGGISIQPKPKLKAYGMGILSMWKSETTTPQVCYPFIGCYGGSESYSSNDFGVSAGVEYDLTPQLVLGAELHGGFYENDDAIRLFALYKL